MTNIESEITCKHCGLFIGLKLYDNLLLIGGLIIKDVHGVCVQCGNAFHYSVRDEQLDCIVKYMITARQAEVK